MLASLIKKDVTQPLSIEMMAKLVPRYCGTAFYDDLGKYKNLTAALGGKKCLVVLYNIHDNKKNKLNQAGHFILINTLAGGVEYFSSSGWSVGKELDVTKSDPEIFKRLLGRNYTQNYKPLEKLGDSNDCWRFCLARAVLAKMPLKDFQTLFSHNLHLRNADSIVTLMTMLSVAEHSG
jgi:hypothetical protein